MPEFDPQGLVFEFENKPLKIGSITYLYLKLHIDVCIARQLKEQ